MLRKALAVTAALAATGVAVSAAAGDHDGPRPLRPDVTWTTVFDAAGRAASKGLTEDRRGNLYAPGRGHRPRRARCSA